MQIRELDLRELHTAYALIATIRPLSYEAFEDCVYEMRDAKYTLLGIFEKGELVALCGVRIVTNLLYGRHLLVEEFVVLDAHVKMRKELGNFIEDYAKMGACASVQYGAFCETKRI